MDTVRQGSARESGQGTLRRFVRRLAPAVKNRKVLAISASMILFNIVYFQSPLYVSNQHTKFLHGLAAAGYGYLENDWLAGTVDPLPVFSALVRVTCRFLNEQVFYLYYAVLLGVYLCSIMAILDLLYGFHCSPRLKIFIFLSLFLAFHSRFFKTEAVFDGAAKQYLLGGYLQPCVFGVLILLSIVLFLKERPVLAVATVAASSWFHSVYLVSAGILTITYMFILLTRKSVRPALLAGAAALVLVAPVAAYSYFFLGPTSSELSARSLDILVNYRIPHHTDPEKWYGGAILYFMLIGGGVFLARKTRMFPVLAIPACFAALSSVIHYFFRVDFIGLLGPWRVTVWLVPVSNAVILYSLASFLAARTALPGRRYLKRMMVVLCSTALALPVLYGLKVMVFDTDYRELDRNPMQQWVYDHKAPGDTYLVPVGMADFRLFTGAPVLVTHKSHPYKDVEVIEWYRRVRLSQQFYGDNDFDKYSMVRELAGRYGVTHVVSGLEPRFDDLDGLERVYRDEKYEIFRIRTGGPRARWASSP